MAKTTDTPVASPTEAALFLVTAGGLKVQRGDELVRVPMGTQLDCSSWAVPALRAEVEIHRLQPLGEASLHKVYPHLFRAPRSIPMPSPIPVNWCGKTYRGPTGLAIVCSQLAEHEGACR